MAVRPGQQDLNGSCQLPRRRVAATELEKIRILVLTGGPGGARMAGEKRREAFTRLFDKAEQDAKEGGRSDQVYYRHQEK